MKHSIIHLAIASATFLMGITANFVLTESLLSVPATNVQKVEPIPLSAPKLTAVAVPASPAPEFILDYDPEEFNPRGDYYILGRKPKGFQEFDCFDLAVDQINGKASGGAMLVTNFNGMNNSYYTVTGFATAKQLNFVAAPDSEDDFEYHFEGHFLSKGVVSSAGKRQAVLKGRLIKLKSGVKVAEGEAKFRVEYLGCC
jgi:hypothetical protein